MPKRILIIDDERMITRLLESILAGDHYDVTAINDPTKALALLETQSFDLLITDVMMPEVSGLELCRRAREMPHQSEMRALVVTVKNLSDDDRKGLMELGIHVVRKPFSPLELPTRVRSLLSEPMRGGRPAPI